MYARIKFDRNIDPEKHYITPGGYEVVLEDGALVQFDFMDYEANIDPDDRTVLHCYMRNLDTVSFPGADKLLKGDCVIKKFEDFYIYTGEDDEEEINPVELIDVSIMDNDGKFLTFDEGCLGNIWEKELDPNSGRLDQCAYCDGIYPESEFDVIRDDGLDTEVKICQECLRDLTSLRESDKSTNTCINCGKEIPDGLRVCDDCIRKALKIELPQIPSVPHLDINFNNKSGVKLSDLGEWTVESKKDVVVDIHKIIDDAMEKRDRSVYILISSAGTSVSINPYTEEKCQWVHKADNTYDETYCRTWFECSNCGGCTNYTTTYCPSCGEQMHGVREEWKSEEKT